VTLGQESDGCTVPAAWRKSRIREFDLSRNDGALERMWRQNGRMKKRRRKYQRKRDLATIQVAWSRFEQISGSFN